MKSYRDIILDKYSSSLNPGELLQIRKWDSLDYKQSLDLKKLSQDAWDVIHRTSSLTCPVFLIRAGPTGSGKTTPTNRIIDEKLLGISQERYEKMVRINIDHLVETYSDLKQEVQRLGQLLHQGLITKEEFETLAGIRYWQRRAILDIQNNALLWEALARDLDIEFETTLAGGTKWLTDTVIQLVHERFPEYKVILIYYYVNGAVLAKRLAARNAQQERKVNIAEALRNSAIAFGNVKSVAPFVNHLLIVDNSPNRPALPEIVLNAYPLPMKDNHKCNNKGKKKPQRARVCCSLSKELEGLSKATVDYLKQNICDKTFACHSISK